MAGFAEWLLSFPVDQVRACFAGKLYLHVIIPAKIPLPFDLLAIPRLRIPRISLLSNNPAACKMDLSSCTGLLILLVLFQRLVGVQLIAAVLHVVCC